MHFKKIILNKHNDKHFIKYENNYNLIYKELDNNDFNLLLNKLNVTNNNMSLADRLVSDFIHDDTIIPSMKKSYHFNDFDMKELIKNVSPQKKKKHKKKVTFKLNSPLNKSKKVNLTKRNKLSNKKGKTPNKKGKTPNKKGKTPNKK